MNIRKVIEDENARALLAANSTTGCSQHARQCIEFFSNWLSLQSTNEEKLGFFVFASEVQKSSLLSFFSVARSHNAQAHWNIRQATEAACQAAYSYTHQAEDMEVATTKKSYAWMNKSTPLASEKIKSIKDYTNKAFTHSDSRSAIQSTSVADGKLWLSHFDAGDQEITDKLYWLVAYTVLTVVDFFIIVDLPTTNFNWSTDLRTRAKLLLEENARIKALLKAM